MLFASNFLGVFNDNFLKNSIIFIAIAWQLPSWMSYSQLISITASGLVLPYLLFSPLGGRWAVNYSKLKVFRAMKLAEIPIMLVACIAFYFQWIGIAVLSIFLMGIQSSLYSPAKYSLIRDIGGESGVSYGSGLFETMAFLGILLGTFFASLISDHYSVWIFSIIILAVAVLGYYSTTKIKVVEQPTEEEVDSRLNPIQFVRNNYRFARGHHLVNSSIFGSSSFWLISNMLQMNVIIHCKHVYQVSNAATGMVMAFAAIGIALGTGITGYYSGAIVRKALIIPALVGVMLSLLLILLIALPFWAFILMVMLFAFMAGAFQVPQMAFVQRANLGRKRGAVIAYLNMVNFVFILIGTALFSLTTALFSENSYAVFAVMIGVTLLVLVYFLFRYPDYREETKKLLFHKNEA